MAINENIIAAYLDGSITYEEANAAMGGFTDADNALIDEASRDDDMITRIAEGADPQQWAGELASPDGFQLPDLPIMAQEADADDTDGTDGFEIVDYADTPVDDYLPAATDTAATFSSDPQSEITCFPDDSGFPDFDAPPDMN